MKPSLHYWALIAAVLLVPWTVPAANINANGASLNLATTDLSSGASGANGAGAKLISAGTPAAGIVSTNGAGARLISEPMLVFTHHDIPVADFSAAPLVGAAPLEVRFFDLSSGGLYEILSWSWDFGDGSPYSSDEDPVHTYNTPGSYTVSLSILTTGGTASTVREHYVTVVQEVPAMSWAILMMLALACAATGGIRVRK